MTWTNCRLLSQFKDSVSIDYYMLSENKYECLFNVSAKRLVIICACISKKSLNMYQYKIFTDGMQSVEWF